MTKELDHTMTAADEAAKPFDMEAAQDALKIYGHTEYHVTIREARLADALEAARAELRALKAGPQDVAGLVAAWQKAIGVHRAYSTPANWDAAVQAAHAMAIALAALSAPQPGSADEDDVAREGKP